jgi:hypothetical protein
MKSKQEIRERVWRLLKEEGVARFPGTRGRIPNFVGAERCADHLGELQAWRLARAIKINRNVILDRSELIGSFSRREGRGDSSLAEQGFTCASRLDLGVRELGGCRSSCSSMFRGGRVGREFKE